MSLRSFVRNWTIGTTAIVAVTVLAPMLSGPSAAPSASAADVEPFAGMQGTDTSLALTDSAVTYEETRDTPFKGLTVTVNQTKNLTNQAISITWTGADQTAAGLTAFDENFLQVMQCWGDPVSADDGTVGPPPEQCEFGATGGTAVGIPLDRSAAPSAISRQISAKNWSNYDPTYGALDTNTDNVYLPFRAVGGDEIPIPYDSLYGATNPPGPFWLNPFFDIITTNEIATARTTADGTGQELFGVETGVQSAGLGCGQHVQPVAGGDPKVPQCWIVVVPRGSAADENVGTPTEGRGGPVLSGPLAPAAWAHRIAIPLEFNPVESPCRLGSDERRMAGSTLSLLAIESWQPTLCTGGDLPPFAFAPTSDDLARRQITRPAAGAAGFAVVSQPSDPSSDPGPMVYAPLTASGLAIGVNVERIPRVEAPEEGPLAAMRVADINLTPRLVAKLLTQSYEGSLELYGRPDYPWVQNNPRELASDPDFLRFNPEFELLRVTAYRTFSGLSVPQGNSDAARMLWQWVMADPEAAAWMAGQPDEWGMRVNPYYTTDVSLNPNGVAFDAPLPNSFPKSDPLCHYEPEGSGFTQPLCASDWMPYARNYEDAAHVARTAADGAQIGKGVGGWVKVSPDLPGGRAMLSLTDTPSATRFGLQIARLSQAGDDTDDRRFISPDNTSMTTAAAAMVPTAVESVLQPAFADQPDGAYPLTVLTYGMIAPLALDQTARHDYAEFVRYAVTDGQSSGLQLGELPPGYAPLPDELQAQSLAAADQIESLQPAPTTTTTTTTAAPSTSSTTPAVPTSAPTVAGQQTPSVHSQSSSQGRTNGGGSSRGTSTGTEQPIPETTSPPPATSSPTVVENTSPPTSEAVQPVSTSPITSAPPIGDEPQATVEAPAPLTPIMSLGRSRMAVPALGSVALAAGLAALEITKRPRPRAGWKPEDDLP